ncbi:hypothetical protein DL95DRAFT_308182 [Leptodontidium sp. 2 PMI_412]|nr:hypothetical protein DL95DRAFT_308182 [Leptodontidium sp. 2 PMI_412]
MNGYDEESYTYFPVLIVGAGPSGIAMACRLKQVLGCDQFRIFDRQSGIGGTWWINRYPGVACDVPAVFYSFSFSPNNSWTSFHPPGHEIVKYLHSVCEKYKIVDKIQLNTEVSEARWLKDEGLWEATITTLAAGTGDLSESDRQRKIEIDGVGAVYIGTEIVRARILVSAVGGLVEPRTWPENVPGREIFEGDIFHSARWNYNVDLTGKDIVVVGTGCSAAQFVPLLTKAPHNAKSVTQVMRSPPWVAKRPLPPGGEEIYSKWSPVLFRYVPGLAWAMRQLIFWGAEYDWRIFGTTEYNERERKKVEKTLIEHVKKSVPEKYHEILIPDYAYGCKRRIYDSAWFPCLNENNINLTTLSLTSVQAKGVTLGPSRTYPSIKTGSKAPTHKLHVHADTIILANGFDTTQWLHPLKLTGRHGQDLHEEWEKRGGPQAYLGLAMDGFPNFFMIVGPNTITGHSSVILASENMVNYSLIFIRLILRGDVAEAEVKHEAEVEFATDLQSQLKNRIWNQGGCRNWYQTESGWNSTVYPWSQVWFALQCMFPRWKHWELKYTRAGRIKLGLSRLARFLVFTTASVGVYGAWKAGISLSDMPILMQLLARMFLSKIVDALSILHSRL